MAVRGIRNKNPGCLRCRGTAGKDSGGFAIYNTWEEGYYALNSVLYRIYDGKSLRQIFKAYAPAFEKGNNPKAYSVQVAKSLKEAGFNVTPDTPLDLSNPEIRAAVVCGIARVECGQIPQGKAFAEAQSRAYNPATDPKRGSKSMSKKASSNKKDPVVRKSKTAVRQEKEVVRVAARKKVAPKKAIEPVETPIPVQNTFSDMVNGLGKSTSPIKGHYVLPGQITNETNEQSIKAALLEEYKDKTPPKKLSWLSKMLPPSLGGASERAKLLDEIFYPKNKEDVLSDEREMFVGVTVADLKAAGFTDEKIVNMQARIDVKHETETTGGLIAHLAQAGEKFTMSAEELGVTQTEMSTISALCRNNSGRS